MNEVRFTSFYINGKISSKIVNLHIHIDGTIWYSLNIGEGKISIVESSEPQLSSISKNEEFSWPVAKFDTLDIRSYGLIRQVQVYVLKKEIYSDVYEYGILLGFENEKLISVVENEKHCMSVLEWIDSSLLAKAKIQ